MKRILLTFLSLFLLTPAFAGEFEDALNTGASTVLYLASPNCSYCAKFDPIYNKLVSGYKNKCRFVKTDVTTKYGSNLSRELRVHYVPFVIFVNAKQKIMTSVTPECMLDYACISKELSTFLK